MTESGEKKNSACYCINLRRAANAVTKYYDRQLREGGLTLNQYSLLINLSRLQPASVTALAGAVKLERTTVTRNLRPLFDMGLIEDASAEGERDRKMQLTRSGSVRIEECKKRWSRAQRKIEEALGPDSLESLMKNLMTLEELI